MSERQSNVGRPKGMGSKQNELPPSKTWLSDELCQNAVAILIKRGRFNKYHLTRSRNNKKEKELIDNSSKIQIQKKQIEKLKKYHKQQVLQKVVEEIDQIIKEKNCFAFFFRKAPINLDQDIDAQKLVKLESLKDKGRYYLTILKLRYLLHPRFVSELIDYIHEISLKGYLVKDLIQSRNKNLDFLTADMFVQNAFVKYLNELPVFPIIQTKENIITQYQQFYQKEQQLIIDNTLCLLQAFEDKPSKENEQQNYREDYRGSIQLG